MREAMKYRNNPGDRWYANEHQQKKGGVSTASINITCSLQASIAFGMNLG